MEIEFEPAQGPTMLDGGAIPMTAMGGPLARPGSYDRHGRHPASREDDLDQAMQGLFGAMLGDQQRAFRPGRTRSAAHKPRETTFTRRPAGDQDMIFQVLPANMQRSSMPIGLFSDLFPGPLVMDQGHSARRAAPFAGPDPLVMDMLQAMNSDIQEALVPLIHGANRARTAPRSCDNDVQKHCSKERSQIHCLGQHQDDISESCRKDISQSVPFLCSRAIDKFCDVLQVGILDCLSGHLGDLEAPCKDSVVATRHAIAKVNTQKAMVKVGETKNGVKTIHAPPRTLSLLTNAAAGEKPGSTVSDPSADIGVPLPEKPASAKVLDFAALVAEAEEASKLRLHAESWSAPWKILALGFCAAVVCIVLNFSEVFFLSRRVSSMLKPYMGTEGASSSPLIGHQELARPV